MVTYPIVEIFHSVQGEAFHAGIPHVFIRFGNCNLRCEWCDTDFLTYEDMQLEDIVNEVLQHNCKRVIFTGGEPCLQDLDTIGAELKKHGINLSVETNGTIPVPEIIDWICVSPKDQVYPNVAIKQRIGHELKQGFEHHFIQPCYMENDTVEENGRSFATVERIVKNNPGWRLSLQTHKWMGVD